MASDASQIPNEADVDVQQHNQIAVDDSLTTKARPATSYEPLTVRNAHRKAFLALKENVYVKLVFGNPQFGCLWTSAIVTQIGNWFTHIATLSIISIANNNETPGLAITGVFLCVSLPYFLLQPFSGVFADRFNRVKIMIASDFLRAALMLCYLFISLDLQRLWWLVYVFHALLFSLESFFVPCKEATIPTLVSQDQILAANTLSSITWSAAMFIGSALGGLSVSTLGTNASYLIDSGAFILSALLIIKLYRLQNKARAAAAAADNTTTTATVAASTSEIELTNKNSAVQLLTRNDAAGNDDESDIAAHNEITTATETSPTATAVEFDDVQTQIDVDGGGGGGDIETANGTHSDEASKGLSAMLGSFGADIAFGVRYLSRHPYVLSIVLTKFIWALIWGPMEAINVKYAESIFKIGSDPAAALGILNTFTGIANAMSPFVCERFFSTRPKTTQRLIVCAFVMTTSGLALVAWSPHIAVWVLGNSIATAGGGMMWVLSTAVLQQVLPNKVRGRILSMDVALHQLGKIATMVAAISVHDIYGVPLEMIVATFSAIGVVEVVYWLIWLFRVRNENHSMRE